jgi:hypothetical protein
VPAGTFASAAIWTTHLQLSGKSHEKSFNQRSGRQSEALFNSLLGQAEAISVSAAITLVSIPERARKDE